ncbi:RsmB/NOP family class I SAM-dependent RNA methyltransferase [Desulfovibrio litoralis]|uniref:16S rRNA (Cytosine1407-C5)-methyltransferase n=1 Tax=Desulfovibrio litoralis DSM 11393 TaxID=1121455 RepID=A0A1M7TQC0_9BACT|nr:RsmB/NOP family class I SAM-dependent RNA methyltransferase [Desulfovibrio litoralis]SHN72944.1 16S rRNA (cytosine1407-C5)-methyltransferase [Desulfovibrio litoralis DSM 11393]
MTNVKNIQNFGRSFRLVAPFQVKENTEKEHEIIRSQQKNIEALLSAEGFKFEPDALAFFKTQSGSATFIRRLSYEPLPLGRSLAAKFGLIYIQDRSSMLPPLALNPSLGSLVLDMCASPGSKTGELAQLIGSEGLVIGNEPGKNRLPVLRSNLTHLNLWQSVTSSYKAEAYPLSSGLLEYIQLDPPCSGWGTLDKNPKVMELWTVEKTNTLVHLQRILLKEAVRLLKVGGRLVYSTCTTNIKENEEQIVWAKEQLGLKLIPLPTLSEFNQSEAYLAESSGVWRINNIENNEGKKTEQNGQGFFVALLEKTENVVDSSNDKKIEFFKEYKKQAVENIEINLSALEEFGYDISRLGQGSLAVFGKEVHLLPYKARKLFAEETIDWRGLPIGKYGNFGVKPLNSLRRFMPSLEEAEKNNQALSLTSTEDLKKLLTGLSLDSGPLSADAKFVFLYYNDLALCRLIKKGKRLLFGE